MTIRPEVVALLFVAAGCGGGVSETSREAGGAGATPAAAPAAKLDACTTLTKEDVSAIVGQSVSASPTNMPGSWAEGANTSVCNYYGNAGVLLSLSIMQPVSPTAGSQGLAAALQEDNSSSGLPASPVKPVDGLGDAAAGYQLGSDTQYLVAQKGGVRVVATAGDVGQARAMMEKALSRVP